MSVPMDSNKHWMLFNAKLLSTSPSGEGTRPTSLFPRLQLLFLHPPPGRFCVPQDWREEGKAGHGGDRDNRLTDGTLLAVSLWLGQIFKTVSWTLTQVLQQTPNFPGREPLSAGSSHFPSVQAPRISPHLQAALLNSIQQNSRPALAPGSHLDIGKHTLLTCHW